MADKKIGYCENCKYWDCYDLKKDCEIKVGECHRNPANVPTFSHINSKGLPIMEGLEYGTPLLSHPFVYNHDWCGEFEEADEESRKMTEW